VEERRPPRKLTTILCADAVGYARQMHDDEEGTYRNLQNCRQSIDRLIVDHQGRIFGTAGDSVMAEFNSPVEAVRCALEIQRSIATIGEGFADNDRMRFRIGINLGDVIVQGDDLIGDGVNVAARLETLSEPDGLCLSASVFEQVRSKLALDYEDIGEQSVKNMVEPVRVFRARDRPPPTHLPWARKLRRQQHLWIVALGCLALVLAFSYLLLRDQTELHRPDQSGRAGQLLSPERTAIAVLPFINQTGDPSQDYFSYGITEDIIAALGRFQDLSVIAHQAVLQYKDKPVSPGELNRDLGVRYQVDGSVFKEGDRIRVLAQLTDALNGVQLWSQRYDVELKNVFIVLDEITRNIAGALAVKLIGLEKQRAFAKPTESLQAYDYLLQGRAHYDRDTRPDNREARRLFEKAIELDPGYSAAYSALGLAHLKDAVSGWTEFFDDAMREAKALALKAMDLDESNAEAHALLGAVYLNSSQYDLVISEEERALALNPSDAAAYVGLGSAFVFLGRPKDALANFEVAMRLNPDLGSGRMESVGWAYYLLHRYEDAVRVFEAGLRKSPDDYFIHAGLAASYAELGRPEDATRAAAAVMNSWPFFSITNFKNQFQGPECQALVVEGLRKAGLK
jgi:TolB-like protein/class 3 adenylate cyclase/Tfp pilus assembly protein PilF